MSATDVIRRYLDAIVEGDLDAVRASFAPDATWWVLGELPIAGTYRGRDVIVDDFLVAVGSRWDAESRVFTLGEPLVAGDVAVVEWRVRATTTEGVPYDGSYCGIFETDGTHITAVREYLDTLHVARTVFPEHLRA